MYLALLSCLAVQRADRDDPAVELGDTSKREAAALPRWVIGAVRVGSLPIAGSA